MIENIQIWLDNKNTITVRNRNNRSEKYWFGTNYFWLKEESCFSVKSWIQRSVLVFTKYPPVNIRPGRFSLSLSLSLSLLPKLRKLQRTNQAWEASSACIIWSLIRFAFVNWTNHRRLIQFSHPIPISVIRGLWLF